MKFIIYVVLFVTACLLAKWFFIFDHSAEDSNKTVVCELYMVLHCFYLILSLLLKSVLLTQIQITGGGGIIETDEMIIELAADILGKVPQPYDIQVVSEQYPVLHTDSMNTVLRQVSHQKSVVYLDIHISSLLNIYPR